MPLTGHCLCGEVRYALDGDLGPTLNCHCSFCRRAHGAAFVPLTLVPEAAFTWTSGENLLTTFVTPGGGERVFCRDCGTRFLNRPKKLPGMISLVLETLDESITQPPSMHINVESKAPWFEILDGGPQFETIPKGPPTE